MNHSNDSAQAMNRLAKSLQLPERTRRVEIILDVQSLPLLRIEAYTDDGSLEEIERVLRLADEHEGTCNVR